MPLDGQRISEEQARAHLAAIVDSSDDAIIGKTLNGIVTSWNRGAERLYGYRAEEAIGRSIDILVPGGLLDELSQVTVRVLGGERVEHLETERIAKDGRSISVSLTLSPILGPDGRIDGISSIARDITERKSMERMLRESETRYRTLVEMAPDAVIVHQDGRFVYANCAALGIYGASALEELQRCGLLDLVHPEERDAVQRRIAQLLEGEEIPLREYRLLRLNGEEVDVESSSTLIDYHGRPSIQLIARDITERKRGERERERVLADLAFERNRFETVISQMPIGVMIAEAPSGRLLHDNEESQRIFRSSPRSDGKLSRFGDWELYRLDGSPLPVEEYPLSRALRGETVAGEELAIVRGDGSRGFVNVYATPIRNAAGELVSGLAAFSDITQHKAAAEALAESEERLNLALDAAEMGSCDMDLATGTGVWSRRHFLLLGYPPPADGSGPATTAMWQELIHPDDRPQVLSQIEAAKRDRSLFTSEHRIVRVDDARAVWVNVQGRFLCAETGGQCRFIGVMFDVTDRLTREQALRRSEERFRLMTDSIPQIAWTAEPVGNIDYLNAHFMTYTGMEHEDQWLLRYRDQPEQCIFDHMHPEDAKLTAMAWRHAVASGEVFQLESRIRRVDGVYRWHLLRAIPEHDEGGRIVRWYGTATDIDELREMQERLRASENKFRWLFESNLIAVFFWNQDGTITEANEAYCDLVGYSRDECRTGRLSWLDDTPPELFARDFAAIEEIMANGICTPYEKAFVNRQDGHRVSVLMTGARAVDSDADGIGFAVDLTELKRTEEALKKSEATLKLAVETAGLGIFDCNLVTGEECWSDLAKRHFGLPPEAAVDHAVFLSGVHPEDRERVERAARKALKPSGNGLYGAEYRTVGIKDQRLRYLSVRGRVSFDERRVPLRLVGACLDITDLVRAEQALKDEISERLRAVEELRKREQLLIRQGRLAAMGEMIGNIAHQWRQPLNTLGLIVQELPRYYERDLLTPEYLDASVQRAMQVINHMSRTIDGFRRFSGPALERIAFKAGEVLAKSVAMVEAAFNEVQLTIEIDADPDAVIFGCPNEFSQVLLNILVNARDAILERKVERPRVAIRLFRENGRSVLTIADNAGGVPAEIVDKIFDPYFTTKGPDKGTGIGLFMSKTIVEKNMNGSLTVRNTKEGAEFRIEA